MIVLIFMGEGEHRTFAVDTLWHKGADLVLVVDADELWPGEVLRHVLAQSLKSNHRTYRIGMRHWWRSLAYVCDDQAMPTRLIRPGLSEAAGEGYLSGKVYHMGYAQSPSIIRYKQAIHGHKGEWRQGWFENKFMNWKPGEGDVHPTNENYWNPSHYEDDGSLKELVGSHQYWHTYKDGSFE